MSTYITYKLDGAVRKIPCKSVLTLGRDMNSDVVLPDLHASRNHAMIRCIGSGDYYLIDGGSSNGSFVNRQRVAMPKLLKNGDRITIGRFEILFEQSKKETGEGNKLSLQDTVISDSLEIKQITVLVADIRGFTTLSEQVDIRTLTKLMNRWFHNVSNAIFDNVGTVDKFIGDCVFARWESTEDQSKTLKQALSAALLINEITRELNSAFSELPEPVKIGVGINTGAASMGIGHDNTALGDAVNIAFRLESATKIFGSDMVLSETAYRHLPEPSLAGKTHHLRIKGKRDPIRVCSLAFDEVRQILAALN